jgi:hypothetical protein
MVCMALIKTTFLLLVVQLAVSGVFVLIGDGG